MFPFGEMTDAVVGRLKIDNYLLSLMYWKKGTLVDATHRVLAVHLGLEGYLEKRMWKKQKKEDQNWNCEYVPHMYVVKGSLIYARWRPPAGNSV